MFDVGDRVKVNGADDLAGVKTIGVVIKVKWIFDSHDYETGRDEFEPVYIVEDEVGVKWECFENELTLMECDD